MLISWYMSLIAMGILCGSKIYYEEGSHDYASSIHQTADGGYIVSRETTYVENSIFQEALVH